MQPIPTSETVSVPIFLVFISEFPFRKFLTLNCSHRLMKQGQPQFRLSPFSDYAAWGRSTASLLV